MEDLFLNKDHMAKFSYMMEELGFEDLRDPYWTSLSFIIAEVITSFSRTDTH